MSERYKRHIKLEHRLVNGQTINVWTDNGRDIMDAASGQAVALEIKADQEGNIRLFDASTGGSKRPALLIPVNGLFHEDGRPQLIPDSMLNEAVQVFADRLQHFEEMKPLQVDGAFKNQPHGAPGLCEAPPGVPFRKARTGKPDDFREARSKDYGDGTEMHEYNGRYNGTPFMAHEITTYTGLVLARYIEYDQPQSIAFIDTNEIVSEIEDVLIVDTEFKPGSSDYSTQVTTNKSTVHMFGTDDEPPM